MIDPVPRDRAIRADRRSAARLNAVQALYQIEQAAGSPEAVIDEFITHRLGREIDGDQYVAPDAALFADLVGGVSGRLEEIDALVAGALDPHRSVERLEAILRSVLRAAAYEMLVRRDVPARVVINEYVDVAHAFFAGAEPGFINGVVDRLGRQLRAGEFEAREEDGDRDGN